MSSVASPAAWRAPFAVAVQEGRRLLVSPVILIGLAFVAMGSAMFLSALFADRPGTWIDDGWTLHIGLFVMGLFVMVATNRAALRDRREHTVEQHTPLPVSPAARTSGLLLAAVGPALLGGVLMVASIIVAGTRLAVPALEPILSVQRIVVLVMFGALGVALAAWAPNPFFAPLVAFALFAASPPEVPEPWHVIFPHTVLETAYLSIWHIAFLLGLTGLFAALAVARTSRWRPSVSAIGASLLVVVVSLTVLMSQVCPTGRPCLL